MFFFCSHWSLVDVPLIFFCPTNHVPDWQPRVLLGMVEARSVNVKKTTTYAQKLNSQLHARTSNATLSKLLMIHTPPFIRTVIKHKTLLIVNSNDDVTSPKKCSNTALGLFSYVLTL